MSKRYRDARGRFRQPTDEERWPDPEQRRHMLVMRAIYDKAAVSMMGVMRQNLRAVGFFAREYRGR